MNAILDRLREGLARISEIVPAMVGAITILMVGYFLARQAERLVDRILKGLDFNKVAEAGGLREVVDRTGSHLDPIHAVGKLFFWVVMLVVVLLASAAMGLENINQMFGIMISFIPTVISAIVIVILGMVVGEFLRGLILASAGTVEGVPTLAKITKGMVVVIAIFMALQQLGVAEEMITSAVTVILGAMALAVGLAFGLGNTKLAGEITRQWYERNQERRSPPPPADRDDSGPSATISADEGSSAL